MAIEIPSPVILKLKQIQDTLKAYDFNIKWVKPENMHLTIKFLGDIDPSQAGQIGDLAGSIVNRHGTVSLAATGLGAFPNINRPRVVWAGLSGQTDILEQLKSELENELEAVGIEKETKKFKGHLTLGRIKKSLKEKRFVQVMNQHQAFETETFTADGIGFFKSDLTPSGPIYTKIRTFPFRK